MTLFFRKKGLKFLHLSKKNINGFLIIWYKEKWKERKLKVFSNHVFFFIIKIYHI